MTDLVKLHEELATVVVAGRDLDEVLTEVVRIAGRALPTADATSITLLRGEDAHTAAFDGQLALDADELQYERGYGPCMDAGRAGQVFVIDDMLNEQRWPDYARNAAAHGVGSSLSVPLPFQGSSIGGLNNYATRSRAFGPADLAIGEEVVSWVALAVSNAEAASRTSSGMALMRSMMAGRAVLERAKGILMERHQISEDDAFTLLTHASQRTNLKLGDVADELVRVFPLLRVGTRCLASVADSSRRAVARSWPASARVRS